MTDFVSEFEQRYPTQADVDLAIARAKRMRAKAVHNAMTSIWAMLQRAVTVKTAPREAAPRDARHA